MNILPKKKWHVRTKENMARVRRDEKKAAEKEKQVLERALLADQEDRVRKLKEKASQRYGASVFDRPGPSEEVPGPSDETAKHVNLFAALEEEERKNLVSGNAEYLAEKKKEQDEWESKMGIMKYLAEGSNELTKQQSWYDKLPDRSIYSQEPTKSTGARPTIAKPFLERILPQPKIKEAEKERKKPKKEKKIKKDKKEKKRKHKHHKKRSRKSSSGSSESSSESEEEKELKRKKLEQLRAERLARERAERIKAEQVFAPKTEVPKTPVEPKGYNSQFNPEFAKQNQPKTDRKY
uniref:CBF1-interacting co-repressor CIR N-terminal domain-containing protein n=1 Tax=Acrobeloides nanus TaxID=290746 RepID=A0A914BZL2_9BILA